jgi:hypothetical protein
MNYLVAGFCRLLGVDETSHVANTLEGQVDIVLGVSMTPTTVRMVLVEGEKGDGATVDHDVFEVSASGDSATLSAADQVVQAVLGTQESAQAGGHHLKSIGVTWTDHADASALRDALDAHGINDVMLVSELHAAGALAQAAGRAVGYGSTALLFLNRDTATLSVVRGDDGSVVKVLSRSLHSTDAMAVLADMAAAVAGQDTAPEGMFVVGSGVDVASVKEHLSDLVDIPVSAPEESGLALARGAALASASAPAFEASTVGLAYSLDPDGPTAGSLLAAADTQLAPSSVPNYVDVPDDLADLDAEPEPEGHKPFLLVGSMASIFVIGVVALAISLAVSIRPTADERPAPARAAVAPSVQAPAPKPAPEALPVQPAPAPPPTAAETIKAPIPVVQQAPQQAPRQVFVEQAPAPQAPAPAPAPVAPPPAPAPVAPPVVPPVWTPPVVLPPPVIVLPRPQWPVWRPPWEQKPRQTQQPDYPDYDDDDYPGYPQQPQQPQPQQPKPQQPQQPQWPWPTGGNGGNGSGGGNSEGSRGDSGSRGDYGRGESGGRDGGQGGQGGGGQGGNCFLIFCN